MVPLSHSSTRAGDEGLMTQEKKLTPVELDRLYLVYKLLIEAGQRQTVGSLAAELAAHGLPVPAAATPAPPRKRGRKPGGKETKK